MTRRGFLKSLGLAVAAASIAPKAEAFLKAVGPDVGAIKTASPAYLGSGAFVSAAQKELEAAFKKMADALAMELYFSKP